MSDNKFIKHLRGEPADKSVMEIKNQRTTTSFANMPEGTSNANDVYSDHRGNAAAVLKGTENWKLSGSDLIQATTVYGDGRDLTDSFEAAGNGLWVDASHTFATPAVFTAKTKWVLKLCGHSLDTAVNNTIGFTLLIKFGQAITIAKNFEIRVESFEFAEEMVVDFDEGYGNVIKAAAGSQMTVQLLCADPDASATIYNGMTVFTALQRRVDGDAVASDTKTFEELEEISDAHISNKNNPHEVTKAQVGLGNCDNTSDLDKPISTATQTALNGKVNIDGSSIMTGPLKMRATSSFKCAIAPFWDGVGFYKLNDDDSVTLLASMDTPDGWVPWENNTYNMGSSLKKWKNLYLSGTAYITKINNGDDLLVPAKSGTLATKEEVDLAANSGRMITDQGVWYAKMYAATTPPSAANGTNYADFSQTDGQGNPIIVIYERQNGAWVQTQTVTPPAEYDGYVPVTSKIWDIAEQASQQGGRVMWNHQSKEFTPYPQIISFDGQNITYSTFSNGSITGTTTISGTAIFTGATCIKHSQNTTTSTTATSKYFQFVDADNRDVGWVESRINNNGETGWNLINLWCRTRDSDNNIIDNSLQLSARPNGEVTATAVNPNSGASTSSKQVATAGWVNTRRITQDTKNVTFAANSMTVNLTDDATMYFIDATADTQITINTANIGVSEGRAKTFEIHIACGSNLPTITWSGITNWLKYSLTSPIETNATSIFAIRVQRRPSVTTNTVVANYGGAY